MWRDTDCSGRPGSDPSPRDETFDWSERRHHVAGRLGTAILAHCVASGWLRRRPADRALEITPLGAAALRDWLGPARWRGVECGPGG